MGKKKSIDGSLYKCRIQDWRDENKTMIRSLPSVKNSMAELAYAVLKDVEGLRQRVQLLELGAHAKKFVDASRQGVVPLARMTRASGVRFVTSEDISDLLEAAMRISRDDPRFSYEEALLTAALNRGFRRIDQ